MNSQRRSRAAALVRLYPRQWRDRYGEEMAQMLADQPVTLRLIVDLIAGAVDARINPQLSSAARNALESNGGTAVTRILTHCQPQDITQSEYLRSVVVLFATTIALAGAYMQLKRTFGDHPVIDAFGSATFPISVLASSWETYLKRYSRVARLALILGMGALVFLIGLAAAFIGEVV
jgi:hypothetical protein